MRWGLLALVVAACAGVDAAEQRSCEVENAFFYSPLPSADILFVVDPRAAALPQYVENVRRFAQLLEHARSSADLHIGVVASADGRLVTGGCLPGAEPYLATRPHLNGSMTTNFAGTFEEAMSCIARVGGGALTEPVGAMERALAGKPSFLRPEGVLQTVIIATEDDTDPAVAGAKAFFTALKGSSFSVLSAVIAPAGSIGWPYLVDGERDSLIAIEDADWTEWLEYWNEHYEIHLSQTCLQGPIGDAERCIVTDASGATQHLLAQCPNGVGARPCWWVEANENLCPTAQNGSNLLIDFERDDFLTETTRTSVRCPCP